jgi:hypothetical protein
LVLRKMNLCSCEMIILARRGLAETVANVCGTLVQRHFAAQGARDG